ncbi:hypothetical protein [Saprospira grandis]|uniref:Uncharacterized protein n=1 Tax=Saprospira grandis (strain Lewin) TaxID=984262 RepID=H6L8G8_SAPGL|nr:hypothetical protein [Saprospira grandis]AFC26693.1 hypothetical protein SGRA_3978 [Saprospira grandis str. Lewin]
MKVTKGYADYITFLFDDEQGSPIISNLLKEEVLIEKCICRVVDTITGYYEKRIEIKDSVILRLDMYAAYIYGGLTITNSVIGYFRLMDGGYNREPIIIRNCVFLGEVDFDESVLKNDIIIEDCIFLKGHDFVEDIRYAVMKEEYFKVKI